MRDTERTTLSRIGYLPRITLNDKLTGSRDDIQVPLVVEMFEAMSGMWNDVGFKSGVNVVENSIWANHSNRNDVSSPLYGVGADIITWPHGNETGDSWFSLRNLTCNHRSGYGCDDFLETQIQPAAALSGDEREAKLYELW